MSQAYNSEVTYFIVFILFQLYFKSSKVSEWLEDDKEEKCYC